MKNKYTSLIIGGIIVFITLLIFCCGLPNGKEAIDYVALLFILIAEAGYFGILYIRKDSTTFSQLAIMPIVTIYSVITILFSLILKNAFTEHITSFVVINIVFMAIAAIVILITGNIVPKGEKSEQKTFEQMGVIRECESKALVLAQNDELLEYRNILEKIYNEIKYNDSVSDYKSGEILSALNEISDSKENADLDALCKKALQLVNERNVFVKQSKRGGF